MVKADRPESPIGKVPDMANMERMSATDAALAILSDECERLESAYAVAVATNAEIFWDESNPDKRALVASRWACGLREAEWEIFSQKCADVWEVFSR